MIKTRPPQYLPFPHRRLRAVRLAGRLGLLKEGASSPFRLGGLVPCVIFEVLPSATERMASRLSTAAGTPDLICHVFNVGNFGRLSDLHALQDAITMIMPFTLYNPP